MKNLKEIYENSVMEYVIKFINKHDLPGLEFWVGEEIGGIAMIGDYYFGFQDIKLDIDEDVAEQTIFEWYDFSLENEVKVNYKSWLKGYRPIKCWISLCYFYYELYTPNAFKYCQENDLEVKCIEDFDIVLNTDHQSEINQYLYALSKCQKLILPKNYSEYNYSRLEHDYFLLNEKRTEDDIIYI